MFERFTDSAREVVVLAQEESSTLKHNYIGTEHILLGLLREDGLAARVLDTMDITIEDVRSQVVRRVGVGDKVATGHIPFTARAKKVFELALREALSLGQTNIGTEHILLGLIRETEGVGAQILLGFDPDAETIRNEILRMLSGPSRRAGSPRGSAGFYIPAEGEATSVVMQRYEIQSPRLLVACPACASPIETVSTDHPTTHLQVGMHGNITCPGCARRWALTLAAR
jgi:ATP-dependent Clp protease ATP-binding subunit ClpC